jgi:electron transport complex protein RnfB
MDNLWTTALIGFIAFVAFGLICGLALAYTAKRFAVKIDPKIEAVRACLPGAN